MAKKILVILIIISLAVIVFVIFLKSKQGVLQSPISEQTPTKTKEKKSTIGKYNDPSGFSFEISSDLKVDNLTDKKPEDYSYLEITSSGKKGKITVEVTDSKLSKIDDFFTKKIEIKKLKLDELEARQYNEKDRIITVAIDQGAFFKITVDPGDNLPFWLTVSNRLISSFAFNPPQEESATSPSSSDSSVEEDVVFEGEEVVE